MLQGAGLGYRRDLADDFLNLSSNNAIQFMEVAPENWVKMGGAARYRFDQAAERYPLAVHGLSLSLGGQAPLDRELLKNTKGVEFVEMNDCDNCCGFGGSYSLLYPEISAPILEKKIQNIKESGANVVALDCPGCLMQIKGGLDARGIDDIKVKHTAEIIAEKRGLI